MKKAIVIIAFFLFIASCKDNSSTLIDTSSFGNINMIKKINAQVYVLNATESSVYKLEGDSLSLFKDIDIRGRDFLLDFDIEGDKVYYSNTYDEIFVSSDKSIEDTIKVFNPDRIAVIDSLLYVTSRKAEDGLVLLKLIDIKSKKEINRIQLNDSLITEMKFAQVTIAECRDGLWVMNPYRNRLEKFDRELKIVSSIEMPVRYEFGNFSASIDSLKVIVSRGNDVLLWSISNKNSKYFPVTNLNSGGIDIRSSCVTEGVCYLYDFLKSSIIINLTK